MWSIIFIPQDRAATFIRLRMSFVENHKHKGNKLKIYTLQIQVINTTKLSAALLFGSYPIIADLIIDDDSDKIAVQ